MTEIITMVRTVLTFVEGLAYVPWVKTVLLLGFAPLVVASCWYQVARRLMHPDSKALAGTLVTGVTRTIRALEQAGDYPPEVARRLEPSARYARLVSSGCNVVMGVYGISLLLLALGLLYLRDLTWDQNLLLWWTFLTAFGTAFVRIGIPIIIIIVSVVLLRLALASAFREWQGIKAGHEHPSQPRIPGLD